MRYTIGIDLGGTNIAAGLLDENYNILHTLSTPTGIPRAPEAIADDMAALAKRLLQEAPAERVGIGAPGLISNGVIRAATNLRFTEVRLAEMMEERLGLPCRLGNDANAAALGEYVAGVAKGADSFIMVTLGTGIGGGIINEGKIVDGFNDVGGEIGHFVLYPNGRPCPCGRKGCFETYCSANALTADTIRAMWLHQDSALWKLTEGDLHRVNGKTAFDAMRLGDPVGTELVNEFIANLALGLSNLVTLLQPEIIAIGGGISREGDTLLVPLRRQVEALSYMDEATPRTKIVAAHFMADAGIVGAAALWEER